MKKITLVLIAMMAVSISCANKPKATIQNSDDTEASQQNRKENKMRTIQLTKADFLTKVVNYEQSPEEFKYLGDKPAIIDFYATWCGPCKAIAPILDELAEEYDGQIYIYKIDVDKEKELAGVFGVRSIPTLLFVPMKGQPQLVNGAIPKETFKKAIDEVLLKE